MNLFLLARNPAVAASLHCDVHVCKMIVETLQMIYSAFALHRVALAPEFVNDDGVVMKTYASTHKHHPCTLWVASAKTHLTWTLALLEALCAEYSKRYGNKRHSGSHHLQRLRTHYPPTCAALDALPDAMRPHDWVGWLVERGLLDATKTTEMQARVALRSPPDGTLFGVVCITGDSRVVDAACDDALHQATHALRQTPHAHVDLAPVAPVDAAGRTPIDAVDTYRVFYAHKAKHMFPMRWSKTTAVPDGLLSAFEVYDPTRAMLETKLPKPPPKRKAERAIDARAPKRGRATTSVAAR